MPIHILHPARLLLFLLTGFIPVFAQSLRFTSGSVTTTNVTLNLAGLTNTWCYVERLNRTNQVWDNVGSTLLGTNATAAFNTTLHEGIYGFFRAKSTNGTYLSTNAFGAVAGTCGTGYSILGNPFAPLALTSVFPSPIDGVIASVWRSGAFLDSYYDAGVGAWDTNYSVGQLEGFFVDNPSTNALRYVISGVFSSNVLTKTLVSGNNLIGSPLYKLISPAIWKIDELNTNQLGGASLIPVQSAGYNPQCTLSRLKDAAGNFYTYTLKTNNVWQLGGTNSVIPLGLVEGFWVNKPTNATWNVSVGFW